MCILCGCVECTGEAALGAEGAAGADAGYVLLNTGEVIINNQVNAELSHSNLKWGSDILGQASDEITWSLSLAGLNMSGFAEQLFIDAANAAFDAWQSVANLTFTYIEGDADIDVTTADASQVPALAGTTVGLASYFYGGGDISGNQVAEITDATIYMDLANAWSPFGESNILSYFGVLLHEIGHALGLDHVADANQIMNTPISTNALGDGDIAGIRVLYGVRQVGSDAADTLTLLDERADQPFNALGGNDQITGSSLADTIYGGLGNDTLSGQMGNDRLVDTRGDNQLNGNGGNDTLVGGLGTLTADGGANDDIIIGGIGDDTLNGGSGNDAIRGDPKGSFLHGNDSLTAGTGDDLLEGGGGADTFVFVPNGGDNTIAEILNIGSNPTAGGRDYEAGIDRIDLSAFGYAPGGSFDALWSDVNGNAVFNDLAQNTQITVIGTLVDELDFIL